MKSPGPRAALALILLAGLASAQMPAAPAPDNKSRFEPLLAPLQCVCSPATNLAGPGEPPSTLRNCQCGSLLCVVHVQSGQLQCR